MVASFQKVLKRPPPTSRSITAEAARQLHSAIPSTVLTAKITDDFISLHQAGLSQLTSQADVEAFLTFYVRTDGYHVGMELEIQEMKLLVESRIFPTFSVYSIAID